MVGQKLNLIVLEEEGERELVSLKGDEVLPKVIELPAFRKVNPDTFVIEAHRSRGPFDSVEQESEDSKACRKDQGKSKSDNHANVGDCSGCDVDVDSGLDPVRHAAEGEEQKHGCWHPEFAHQRLDNEFLIRGMRLGLNDRLLSRVPMKFARIPAHPD